MLRLMLNAHPQIAIPYESDFIPKVYRKLIKYGDLSIAKNMESLLADVERNAFVKRGKLIGNAQKILAHQPKTYSQLIDAIYTVYAEQEGKSRWGDKDPDNVLEIDVLWSLFPHCRVIHIVRDGRAVANSLRKLDWGSRNIVKLAHDWSWKATLARKMGAMLGPQYMEIKYENLVSSPEFQLRMICDFIGESYDEHMLYYHQATASILPESALKYHSSATNPPDASKIDAWRDEMSYGDKSVFERTAGPALKMFGYRPVAARRRFSSRVYELKYALF